MGTVSFRLYCPGCGTAIKGDARIMLAGFGKLARLWLLLILVLYAPPALAAPNDCRPEGMSDAEAARIIVIATEQGKAFRAAIDNMRASGMGYDTDTTYDDLMSDPERAIALARERYEGRITSQISYSPESLIAMGAEVEGFLENHLDRWIKKPNYNYFTIELTGHLEQLAMRLGGEPMDSPYKFSIDSSTLVFALGHFAESAELKYIYGSSEFRRSYVSINFRFSEKWALWARKPNFQVRIFLTSNPSGNEVTLDNVTFGPGGMLKNPWPIFEPRNEGCLSTFKQMKE